MASRKGAEYFESLPAFETRPGCLESSANFATVTKSELPHIPSSECLVTEQSTFPGLEHGAPHTVSKRQKPSEYPDRGEVPVRPGPEYRPTFYVSPKVSEAPPWAEPVDFEAALKARAERAGISIETLGVEELSLLFPSYETPLFVDKRPRNPRGVTGITGQGLLGKHGENTAADPIVFRRYSGSASGQTKLQMIAIQRSDNGMWAIPGGMTDFGETVSETLGRELREEALGESVSGEEAERFDKNFKDLFEEKGVLIYQGAVDDFRNTDTSWMASKVMMMELDESDAERLGWDMSLTAGDDAAEAKWMDVSEENLSRLNANHGEFVAKAVLIWQRRYGLAVRKDGVIGRVRGETRRS